MIRRITIACTLFALLTAEPALAATKVRGTGNFGIGIGAGTFATGVSMKYFLQPPLAIQGTVGWWRHRYYDAWGHWHYGGGDSLALSADLLWEMPRLGGNQAVDIVWMLGGGAGLGLDDYDNDIGLGVSFVIGIGFNINVAPIDIVVEYRPGIYMLPVVDVDLIDFTAHVRYFF